MSKKYDIILFGVTGFTGKLAAEYLLSRMVASKPSLKWAICGRNEAKAKQVLVDVSSSLGLDKADDIDVLVADLVCDSDEKKEILRQVVTSTKVVLTCAGPFEKYGMTLLGLCATEGVHYADITGETSFVRQTISQWDSAARKSGAVVVSHCGNDCVPQDMTVFQMHEYAKAKDCSLEKVNTYNVFPPSAEMSGGTISTAIFQLGENKDKDKKTNASSLDYDPLLMVPASSTEGDDDIKYEKSKFSTRITNRKPEYVEEFKTKANPWIMSPVMSNCVRRSNALLGYAEGLQYGDSLLDTNNGILNSLKQTGFALLLGAAIYIPPVRDLFLPKAGEGPSREAMESGHLTVHGRAVMVPNDGKEDGKKIELSSKLHFPKDTAYLMTAQMLVECGLLLIETKSSGGVVTPATAFGTSLTDSLRENLKVTFEITEKSNES